MKPKDYQFMDLGLFIPKHKSLVIGDIHVGIEEDFVEKGVFLPATQFKSLTTRIVNLIKKTGAEVLVINGDIKHTHGPPSNNTMNAVAKLIKEIQKHCRLVFTKGNHDSLIHRVLKHFKVEYFDHIVVGNNLICHGHKKALLRPAEKAKVKNIIISHEHPAITLREGIRSEKFKCYVCSDVKQYGRQCSLTILPSFDHLSTGMSIDSSRFRGFYAENIVDMHVYIFENNKVYYFGEFKPFD
ncbi:metallophosphoesterase [Candidatus Woesearchaeota archaeon]|nr:metallophosphoesterase [Candidatus Woesearchaeota archaeon]